MRRLVAGLLASATALAACTSAGSGPTPHPRITPRATVRVTPKPTIRLATPTPRPTRRPARITAGKLTYDATGCWRSGWTDAQGHQRGGVKVGFGLSVTNRGEVASDPVWLMVSTDSDIAVAAFEPGKAGRWVYPGGLYGIKGPSVGPGKTARITWSVVFFTPFDPHYTIDLLTARGSDAAYDAWLADDVIAYWSEWTSSVIC